MLSVNRIHLAVGYIIIFLAFDVNASAGEYITDRKNNCMLWNPSPVPNEQVEWNGSCEAGFIEGFGQVQWINPDGTNGNYEEGEFKAGHHVGKSKVRYPSGLVFNGELNNVTGDPQGDGKYIFPNGDTLFVFIDNGKIEGSAQKINTDKSTHHYQFKNNYIQDVDGLIAAKSEINNLEKLKTSYLSALAIAENDFGRTHIFNAHLLLTLGTIAVLNGDLTQAEQYFYSLMTAAQKAKDTSAKAISYYWYGATKFGQKDFKEAKKYLQAYINNIELEDRDDLTYSSARNYLSLIYFYENDDKKALENAQIALSFAARQVERNPLAFAEAFQLYSLVSYLKGNQDVAIETMLDALKKWEAISVDRIIQFDKGLFVTRNNYIILLNLLVAFDRLEDAKSIIEKYKIMRNSIPSLANNNEEFYLDDINISAAYIGILLKEKNCIEAEKTIRKIIEKFDLENKLNPSSASVYFGFSRALLCQQRPLEALAEIEKARVLIEKNEYGIRQEVEQKLKLTKAKIYLALKKYREALYEVQNIQFLGPVDQEIFEFFSDLFESGQVNNSELFDVSFKVAQRGLTSESSKASDQLTNRILAGTSQASILMKDLQDQERILESLNQQYSKAILKEEDPNKWEGINSLTFEMHKQKSKILEARKLVDETSGILSSSTLLRTIEKNEIRQKITDDDILIYYYFGKNGKSYAWVLTKNYDNFRELKIDLNELKDDIEKLRANLIPSSSSFDFEISWKIYEKLLLPFSPELNGKKKLFVVANDITTSIPLQLLVDTSKKPIDMKDASWLFKKYAIVNIPSISYFRILNNTSKNILNQNALMIADPVFNKNGSGKVANLYPGNSTRSILEYFKNGELNYDELYNSLQALPFSKKEVIEVGSKLKGFKIDYLVGKEATEKNFRDRDLTKYSLIYFATHALVAGDIIRFSKSGAEPALVLSRQDEYRENYDGLLFSSEIAGLKLNANWVILSACNTAAANNFDGEALSGLAKAFIFAGARSILVSHWEVSDFAASQILPSMFNEDAEKLSNGEKLQYALIIYFKTVKSAKYLHPKYWAPFMVIGD